MKNSNYDPSSSIALFMNVNTSLIALGIIPYNSYISSGIFPPFLITSTTASGPSMLNVLPVPLIPYAKMVPLKPWQNYLTVNSPANLYIFSWLVSPFRILSNVNFKSANLDLL